MGEGYLRDNVLLVALFSSAPHQLCIVITLWGRRVGCLFSVKTLVNTFPGTDSNKDPVARGPEILGWAREF